MKTYLQDLGERVLRTAAGVAAAAWLAAGPGNVLDLTVGKGAVVTGLAAGVTLLLGILAKWSGDKNTASFRK